MTLRFLRLLAGQLLLVFACAQAQAAGNDVDIVRANIESTEEGYRLSAAYAFELNHGLEDAIQHGVQLYFTTEIELTRPRWYWYDDRAVTQHQTLRISYNVLTRQYQVSVQGSMQQSFSTLEDAMVLIRRPSRWLIAPHGALKPGETYNVTLRMFMDRERLPKPIQLNASNAQWRLESKDRKFQYRAE
ncbi:MAG: DUF4390 domain-containing protein [Massilia sp.]